MSEKLSASTERPLAPDVCLLLRAHAEQLWLRREVISVLRQLESENGVLHEEQLGAAFAYLEVIWLEALRHAQDTEAARQLLDQSSQTEERAALCAAADRYHGAVKDLRRVVALRVQHLSAASPGLTEEVLEEAANACGTPVSSQCS